MHRGPLVRHSLPLFASSSRVRAPQGRVRRPQTISCRATASVPPPYGVEVLVCGDGKRKKGRTGRKGGGGASCSDLCVTEFRLDLGRHHHSVLPLRAVTTSHQGRPWGCQVRRHPSVSRGPSVTGVVSSSEYLVLGPYDHLDVGRGPWTDGVGRRVVGVGVPSAKEIVVHRRIYSTPLWWKVLPGWRTPFKGGRSIRNPWRWRRG